MTKLTEISLHGIAHEQLSVLLLVEDILVNSRASKQEYIAVICDGTFCQTQHI